MKIPMRPRVTSELQVGHNGAGERVRTCIPHGYFRWITKLVDGHHLLHQNRNNMLEEDDHRCQSDEGPPTPPVPSRAPPPLAPPSFVRSQSLGISEESLALTLLGRHTHYYYDPNLTNNDKKLDQLEFTKVSFFLFFFLSDKVFFTLFEIFIFCKKNSTLISRENCRFCWSKNSWKCCGFGL